MFPFGTAEALAGQVAKEHYDKGMIYPPLSNIRTISANIAANVAAKAYELGEYSFLLNSSSISYTPSVPRKPITWATLQLGPKGWNWALAE